MDLRDRRIGVGIQPLQLFLLIFINLFQNGLKKFKSRTQTRNIWNSIKKTPSTFDTTNISQYRLTQNNEMKLHMYVM